MPQVTPLSTGQYHWESIDERVENLEDVDLLEQRLRNLNDDLNHTLLTCVSPDRFHWLTCCNSKNGLAKGWLLRCTICGSIVTSYFRNPPTTTSTVLIRAGLCAPLLTGFEISSRQGGATPISRVPPFADYTSNIESLNRGAVRLRRLSINQFKRFTVPTQLGELGDGLNLVVGPNELGKSTLLDALRAVLFERYSSRARPIMALQNDRSGAAPVVELVFEVNGAEYALTKRFVKSAYARLKCPDGTLLEADAAETELRSLLGFAESGTRGATSDTLGCGVSSGFCRDSHSADRTCPIRHWQVSAPGWRPRSVQSSEAGVAESCRRSSKSRGTNWSRRHGVNHAANTKTRSTTSVSWNGV